MIRFNELEIVAELFPGHLLIFVLIVSQVEKLLDIFEANFGLNLSQAR